mmetsp:Transcript_30915/g.67847  ORF Transcript_30915/g.67847 Transcript_30915/m.67847 type:complete len:646 (-) Transcript_30915:236-2173(-)
MAVHLRGSFSGIVDVGGKAETRTCATKIFVDVCVSRKAVEQSALVHLERYLSAGSKGSHKLQFAPNKTVPIHDRVALQGTFTGEVDTESELAGSVLLVDMVFHRGNVCMDLLCQLRDAAGATATDSKPVSGNDAVAPVITGRLLEQNPLLAEKFVLRGEFVGRAGPGGGKVTVAAPVDVTMPRHCVARDVLRRMETAVRDGHRWPVPMAFGQGARAESFVAEGSFVGYVDTGRDIKGQVTLAVDVRMRQVSADHIMYQTLKDLLDRAQPVADNTELRSASAATSSIVVDSGKAQLQAEKDAALRSAADAESKAHSLAAEAQQARAEVNSFRSENQRLLLEIQQSKIAAREAQQSQVESSLKQAAAAQAAEDVSAARAAQEEAEKRAASAAEQLAQQNAVVVRLEKEMIALRTQMEVQQQQQQQQVGPLVSGNDGEMTEAPVQIDEAASLKTLVDFLEGRLQDAEFNALVVAEQQVKLQEDRDNALSLLEQVKTENAGLQAANKGHLDEIKKIKWQLEEAARKTAPPPTNGVVNGLSAPIRPVQPLARSRAVPTPAMPGAQMGSPQLSGSSLKAGTTAQPRPFIKGRDDGAQVGSPQLKGPSSRPYPAGIQLPNGPSPRPVRPVQGAATPGTYGAGPVAQYAARMR